MSVALPFLTSYDPPGTSEGTLDPLGLYQIADQLAVQLVPAVRERMQRIRFLTAMSVGAIVTEGLNDDPQYRDAAPYLIWEWHVVEAIIRSIADDASVWGVPGTLVTRRSLDQRGYLDARGYLKTARIFGFHGVYKRLAIHLGLVDVHLGPGPNTERLVDAWSRGLGLGGINGAKPLIEKWTSVVKRSLREKPPRTKPSWNQEMWKQLAVAFSPSGSKSLERRYLRELLHSADDRRLGALTAIWKLQPEFEDGEYREEALHKRLAVENPEYRSLLAAIRAYETFCRSLEDAFDILKAVATCWDTQGFIVPSIAKNADFETSVKGLHDRFEAAHHALGEVPAARMSLQHLFLNRFGDFAEPMSAADCALTLCSHHETVQSGKSANGKRPWFDRLGSDRIYVRHAYREKRREIAPSRYVHEYRGRPIRRFYRDLK